MCRYGDCSMKYQELEDLVLAWADEKGILEKATPTAQMRKLREEVKELGDAIKKGDVNEMVDAMGDIQVVIIIMNQLLAQEYGHKSKFNQTVQHHLNVAYDVIKKRTGKMVRGVFVKDE